MRVVLYARASESGLAALRAAMKAEAARHGWDVVGDYSDAGDGNEGLLAGLVLLRDGLADALMFGSDARDERVMISLDGDG